jgi:hypothetical protein
MNRSEAIRLRDTPCFHKSARTICQTLDRSGGKPFGSVFPNRRFIWMQKLRYCQSEIIFRPCSRYVRASAETPHRPLASKISLRLVTNGIFETTSARGIKNELANALASNSALLCLGPPCLCWIKCPCYENSPQSHRSRRFAFVADEVRSLLPDPDTALLVALKAHGLFSPCSVAPPI